MNSQECPIILELKNIKKSFGDVDVLNGIDLTVHEGDFVTFLGSSGCGKTTVLRIIAGLEEADTGEVLLQGKEISMLPPEKRNVNTVFQSYALFPHMNVYQNIAYGLKLRGVDKKEIKKRVTEMLELVQLSGFEHKMPSTMSGGQKQRVAIARALINEPKLLLLDEPLGALDLQLRRQMQLELKRLQKKLGITFLYITHDQEEAINMSDYIAVMRNGVFEQVGTPEEIYEHPKTGYVAGFVGSANIIRGSAAAVTDESVVLEHSAGRMVCKKEAYQIEPGQNCTLAVRSENVEIGLNPESEYALRGRIEEKNFAGGMLRIEVSLGEMERIVISRHGINSDLETGAEVYLWWPAGSAVLVEEEAQ